MNPKLIPYAADFTSYLLQKTANIGDIKEVIMFGSAARGEGTPESDVDIFINTTRAENIAPETKEILRMFNESTKYREMRNLCYY